MPFSSIFNSYVKLPEGIHVYLIECRCGYEWNITGLLMGYWLIPPQELSVHGLESSVLIGKSLNPIAMFQKLYGFSGGCLPIFFWHINPGWLFGTCFIFPYVGKFHHPN